HRIEVCVPVQNNNLNKELIDYFEIQWRDNDKAVILTSNLSQVKPPTDQQEILNAQETIYNYLQNIT
ncbi:MAG: hypothetical protein ABJA71_08495, partial [Ginsengibacter sp.]